MAVTSTVWMIHRFANPRTGVRGNLSLDVDVLRFEPAKGGAPTSVRLEDIVKVDRVAGSPVLILGLERSHRLPEILFYFVEPPYMFGKPAKITLRVGRFVPARRGLGVGSSHRGCSGRRGGLG